MGSIPMPQARQVFHPPMSANRYQTCLGEVFSKFNATQTASLEILSRTRYLCAKYLGGAWTRVGLCQFHIKPVTGGMSNLLFFVELAPNVESLGTEARQALLRIQCQTDLSHLVSESVVFTLLSERSLGPKLLGVFPGGRFEQFIPSRPLQCREISLPALIAPMLARVHTLDVPIPKDPQVMTSARGWLAKFRQSTRGALPIDIRCTAARVSSNLYPSSVTCDELEKELDFVEEFLVKSKSPVVFSHNDLQEGNVLLFDGYDIANDGSISARSDDVISTDPLVLIDFEYCSYNYRGFDLGNHFSEYGYDYNCDEAPYYKIYGEMFEVTHERQNFCAAYLDEVYKMRDSGANPNFPSDLVTGDRDADLSRLITESTLFMAVANIFWSCWALVNAEDSVINFDYASYARDRLALYYHQKKALQNYLDLN
uniref:Choline/ethanolamine kinase n=1 Tax=Angiostrongylus cantonensis TaxID=6313 RepID=A0A0K0D1E9_ANGCA